MGNPWEQDLERARKRAKLFIEQQEAYIAMLKGFECAICSAVGGVVKLLGGRNVPLCADHTNAWHEFLDAHKLKGLYNDRQAEYDVAIHQRDEKVARDSLCALQEMADWIYGLSGEWLEEEKRKWQER